MKFLVDTGSPESLLSEEDAQRMQIPFNRLHYDKTALIGGTRIQEAAIRDVSLGFKTDEGSIHTIRVGDFLVTKNMRSGSKTIMGLPSILGNDFLLKNRLSLHVNPAGNEAYYLTED